MGRTVTNIEPMQSGTVLNLPQQQNASRRFERQSKQKTHLARGIQCLICVEIIGITFLEIYGAEFVGRMRQSVEVGYLIEYSS
jgi:hypothetical protein